jgi:Transposase DDE domain group 1
MERHEWAVFSSPVAGRAIHAAFDGGRLTSDAGVLVLADIERRLGIAERLARCLADPRSPGRVHHTMADMIRFRVLLIAAGYPDANDCDALRSDPAFKMALGRAPERASSNTVHIGTAEVSSVQVLRRERMLSNSLAAPTLPSFCKSRRTLAPSRSSRITLPCSTMSSTRSRTL